MKKKKSDVKGSTSKKDRETPKHSSKEDREKHTPKRSSKDHRERGTVPKYIDKENDTHPKTSAVEPGPISRTTHHRERTAPHREHSAQHREHSAQNREHSAQHREHKPRTLNSKYAPSIDPLTKGLFDNTAPLSKHTSVGVREFHPQHKMFKRMFSGGDDKKEKKKEKEKEEKQKKEKDKAKRAEKEKKEKKENRSEGAAASKPKKAQSGSGQKRESSMKRRHRKKHKGPVNVDTSKPLEWPSTPEMILEYHKQKSFLTANEEWFIVELNEFECMVDNMDILKLIAKHTKFLEIEPPELIEEFFNFVEELPTYDEIINYDVWQEFTLRNYDM